MNDLNTIHRLNVEAHAKSIDNWRSSGKHVLATYTGLTLFAAVPYDTQAEAERALATAQAQRDPTQRYEVLAPTRLNAPAPVSITRDQSEDTGASFASVADYFKAVPRAQAA